MTYILRSIIKFRKSILIFFGIAVLLSVLMLSGTSVNYKMVDYLPSEANSTQAISVLKHEFGEGLPNLSVMINDISIQEAIAFKEQLMAVDGVTSVLWLDDVVGLDQLRTVPLAYLDQQITEAYYKEQKALYSLTIASGKESSTVDLLYDLIGENNSLHGDAMTNASAQNSSESEVAKAMIILVPILIFMLIVATDSWLEPIFFLCTIGIAIAINMGTNAFLGEISFITSTVSPILQLAVSMDYAIFLLHSFVEKRKHMDPEEAMFQAMKASMPTVAASALTTMVGFSALIFMRFGIGSDLGLNLLKGITLSFLSVMIFLPVVTLIFHNAIEKTMHKSFMPHPGRLSGLLLKIRGPLMILALIVAIPAFLGQSEVEFLYGMETDSPESRAEMDKEAIDAVFGNDNVLLLLVPREGLAKEAILVKELEAIDGVNEVVNYTNMVSDKLPVEYVPDEAVDNFYSGQYARIIMYTSIGYEGDQAFQTTDLIKAKADELYETSYLTGQTATLNDMKQVVDVDLARINLIAVIGIFIVLFLTFKSISIPIVLIFTIETAIWLNLSVPYFTDTPISFIGYLILSTVQLGATVDYAILMTHKYMDARREKPKKEAMLYAIKENISAILISATILSTAGFVLAATTNISIIKELGVLLGRGTLLSFTMVVAVLPGLLLLLDGVIRKTTLNHRFYKLNKEDN